MSAKVRSPSDFKPDLGDHYRIAETFLAITADSLYPADWAYKAASELLAQLLA